MAHIDGHVFHPPKKRADWGSERALQQLQDRLQTAMILELHTIPLYLFAAYSIKDNGFSAHRILGVVRQEMLHLGLVGNILRAVRGRPRVYGEDVVPRYPTHLFYDKVELRLRAAKDNVAGFADVERPKPWQPRIILLTLIPDYDSIGSFYQDIEIGLTHLHGAIGDTLFDSKSSTQQFHMADGSWYDEDMMLVEDFKSAKKALQVVVDQGEGNHGQPVRNTVQTHYEIFNDLASETLDCYPVIEDPITSQHEEKKIYKVMIASDAAYSYLLLTIEVMWFYDGPRRRELVTNNIMRLMMHVLKPLGLFLVTQPLDEQSNAAAPFNFFQFNPNDKGNPTKTAYTELKSLMDAASAEYPHVGAVTEASKAVGMLLNLNELQLQPVDIY